MTNERIDNLSEENDFFVFIPENDGMGGLGNREAPPESQLSIEIRRLTSMQTLAQISGLQDETLLQRWRDRELKKYMRQPNGKATDEAAVIGEFSTFILSSLRQIAENTRRPVNFFVDGQALTNPIEVYLYMAGDLTGGQALVKEIQSAINEASTLTGDDLKNFKGRFATSSNPGNIA